MKRSILLSLVVAFVFAGACYGRGMLIPKDTSLPPLGIKNQRVSVEIDSQLAATKVEQVFQNNTDRVLEATYIFPLPPGAVIDDFAMFINGKRTGGELVEKDKAREVYTQIVRRMRDPGLLEYMGGNLFKLNVYPIPANGEQRLEVRYTEILKSDSGMVKYVYPLKTEEDASRTLEDFTFSVTLKSKAPITNIYSPSHQLGISRKGEHEAVIGFEKDKALLDRDVELYYTVSEKAFGINLMTHRPEKDKDGYFMLLITPREYAKADEILPRDVCFVLDTSGSMQTDHKMKQAQEALKYCVGSLREADRFTVIAFATSVEPMSKVLLAANKENKEKANAFIDAREAMGGTLLAGALAEAKFVKRENETERPYIIVFLTDGKPTVGEDRTDEIVKMVAGDKQAMTRIFTWGVGTDVNTHLLDRIAKETRAVSEYVTKDENIEQKVSLFFNKMSKPVLANASMDWGKMQVKDVYPKEIGDLFAGQQVTVLGRYAGTGDAAVTLEGSVRGKQVSQTYEGTFGDAPGSTFIEKLWASRQVGFLLDEIRLKGENKELKDEVIRLSRTYGIQTPYTSYLVLETPEEFAKHGIARPSGRSWSGAAIRGNMQAPATTTGPAPMKAEELTRRLAENEKKAVNEPAATPGVQRDQAAAPARQAITGLYSRAEDGMEQGEAGKGGGDALRGVSGDEAVRVAREIKRLKSDTQTADAGRKAGSVAIVKRVGERSFYAYGGFWIDGAFSEKQKTLNVKYLSDGYFKLLEKCPELKDALALGERVIVVVNDVALIIEDAGKETLDAADLQMLGVK